MASTRGVAAVAIAVFAFGGCATDSAGRSEAAAKSSNGADESSGEPEPSKTTESGKSLPEPSDEPVGGESSGRERERCDVTSEDWRGIDFRDADELHRRLVDNREAFRGCLEAFPANEKYFVKFEVRDGRVAGARPARLSQLLTRRLDREDRTDMQSCLDETVEELEIAATSDGDSYEITHPFCTP